MSKLGQHVTTGSLAGCLAGWLRLAPPPAASLPSVRGLLVATRSAAHTTPPPPSLLLPLPPLLRTAPLPSMTQRTPINTDGLRVETCLCADSELWWWGVVWWSGGDGVVV